MKKAILLILVILGFSFINQEGYSQNVNIRSYQKQRTTSRRPISYAATREADIMWSKKIWRIIDLREKINHPLYFPTTPVDHRMSLFSLIMYGIENEGLTPYAGLDDEFKVPMTLTQVEREFGAVADTTYVTDVDTGEEIPQVSKGEVNTQEVKQIMLQEEWYFDKNLSSMQVRIIGICPVRFYTREGSDEVLRKLSFWIYFPEARQIFANHEVFNARNDANRISFDDIFHKRIFNSYIVGKSNVYDNRRILEYTNGYNAMLEAEKIKSWLFEVEHDLWEF